MIDALRGVAILAMVAYHVGWDLYFLGFIGLDVTNDPVWVMFQRAIVSSFLALVGVGLVLAHGDGIGWRGFWRRFAVIAGAALLTSLGTYIVFPDYFVFFGVLHAIALFSLLGLAFVGAPLWLVLVTILIVMLPPALITSPVMIGKPLSWIGFWPSPPMTTDIVPVFPWFGVVLIGILGMRLLMRSPVWAWITGPRLEGAAGRGLRFLGRWSLVIYLVHQPLIYGSLSLIAPTGPDEIGFLRECETSCAANGSDPATCARYCGCALEEVTRQSLWAEVATVPPTDRVAQMTRLCAAMAGEVVGIGGWPGPARPRGSTSSP